MSGITALFRLDARPVSRSAVDTVAHRLGARGPGRTEVWREGPQAVFLLGPDARAPEAARPPALAVADDLVVAFDGRLDNRTELAHALGLDPATISPRLILAAVRQWGRTCVERLVGPFAFVVYHRTGQRIVLARDALGVRPLCYAHIPGRLLAVSSDLPPLLGLDGVSTDVDDQHVADYLGGVLMDRESTFVRGVRRLAPATILDVGPEGTRRRTYWAPDPDREIRESSDQAYVDGFRERFMEAVRCRVEDAEPTGVLLSGGLDSSLVAGAARLAVSPLHAFSATFADLSPQLLAYVDERSYAQAVVDGGGIVAHDVPAATLRPLAAAAAGIARGETPTVLRNGYLSDALYRSATASGVRVVLDGLEGDLTVSHGYGRLGELAATGAWSAYEAEERALVARIGASPAHMFAVYGWPHVLRGGPVAWRAGLRHGLRSALVRRQRPQPSVLSPSLAERTGALPRHRDWERAFMTGHPTERAAHAAAHGTAFSATALEALDRSAAAVGVEHRHPFYDRRLVEYCLALPADQKLRDGWTRYVARRAGAGLIADSVRWRPGKARLGPNFKLRLLRDEQEAVRDLLDDAPGVLAPYIDLRQARDRVDRRDVESVWPVLMLSLWLRKRESIALPESLSSIASIPPTPALHHTPPNPHSHVPDPRPSALLRVA